MSMAIILAHPQMNAEQACQVARRDGLLLIHTKRGNYRYESSAAPSPKPTVLLPVPADVGGAVAGPLGAA